MGRYSPIGPVSRPPGKVWQNKTILVKSLTDLFFYMSKNNFPSPSLLKMSQEEWQRFLETLEAEANTWQSKFQPNQVKAGIWKQGPYNSRCPVDTLNEKVHHCQAPVKGNINKRIWIISSVTREWISLVWKRFAGEADLWQSLWRQMDHTGIVATTSLHITTTMRVSGQQKQINEHVWAVKWDPQCSCMF